MFPVSAQSAEKNNFFHVTIKFTFGTKMHPLDGGSTLTLFAVEMSTALTISDCLK
jgi:hypothetical protein